MTASCAPRSASWAASTNTSHWLVQLLAALVDATAARPSSPSIGETWTLVADGVTDMGQLSVLLSEVLAEPLGRIGIDRSPRRAILDVMRGAARRRTRVTYSCPFHCYPVEAVDPADGMPKDGQFMWRAPGGTGHAQPAAGLPARRADGERWRARAGRRRAEAHPGCGSCA